MISGRYKVFYGNEYEAVTSYSAIRDSVAGFMFFALIFTSVTFFISFIPMIIAYVRKHPKRQFIAIISFIVPPLGFIIALIWALTDTDPENQWFSNLFSSRKKEPDDTPRPDPQLLKALFHLDSLYRQGILTEEEYKEKRAEIIKRL